MSEKLQVESDTVDIMDVLVELPLETKDKDFDMKDSSTANENLGSASSKSNREVKSVLAPKAAVLDTNIHNKRNNTDSSMDTLTNNMFDGINFAALIQKERAPTIRIDYHKNTPVANINHLQETNDVHLKSKTCIHRDVNNRTKLDHEKLNRNAPTNMVIVVNNMRKDPFCWKCHHDKPTIYCEACPRSFHQKCLKHFFTSDHWVCPVCIEILDAETSKQSSPVLQKFSPEQFSNLLKFAINRMKQVEGHEPFIVPVNEADFPDYKKYVAQPQDLTYLEKNIDANVYGSTQAFEADARWILHNSIIFNSNQSKLTAIAKYMVKICQQDMYEIDTCATCYLNANTKPNWFVDVCPKPHMVVWAKLKSFPYWPAKAVRINRSGDVDVRFFGAHDRAWVSCKDCFLYCLQDPNTNKQKRNDINESIKELNIYIENLKRIYGEFCYAPNKIPIDPEREITQLKLLLPNYDPNNINPGRRFRKGLHQNNNCSSDFGNSQKNSDQIIYVVSDNSAELNSNDYMQNALVNTTDTTKAVCKTSLTRKRASRNEANDIPSKLSRHDGNKNINSAEDKTSEEFHETNHVEVFMPVTENDISSKLSRPNSNKNIYCTEDETSDEFHETNHVEASMPVTEKHIPSKLSRHDSNKNIDSTEHKTSEEFHETKHVEALMSVTENDSCKVTVETETSSKLPIVFKPNEVLLQTLSDLIGEEPDEGIIDVEANSLLDVSNNIDSILEKPPELPVNNKKIQNIREYTLPNTSFKSTDNETVEVIEVNVLAGPESVDSELLNVQNIDQATDISTVSVSPVKHKIDTISKPIQQSTERTDQYLTVNCIELLDDEEEEGEVAQSIHTKNSELLEQSLNSCSSLEDFTTASDLIEVTENMPIEDKDDSDEETLDKEKHEDVSNTFNQTIEIAQTKAMLEFQQCKCAHNSDLTRTPINAPPRKRLRLVNIDDIRNKILDNPSSPITTSIESLLSMSPTVENHLDSTDSGTAPIQSIESLLEKHLRSSNTTSNNPEDCETLLVNNETNCGNDENDPQMMAMKKMYLSALNITEKQPQAPKKTASMRTRSKSEEHKFKILSNISKVLDGFNSNCEGDDMATRSLPLKRKEIFVKPISNLIPKQRAQARKTFAVPVRNVYSASSHKKDVRIGKPIPLAPNMTSVRPSQLSKPSEPLVSSNNILYIAHPASATNAVTVLPPNQSITYSANRSSPMFAVVQHPNNYLPLTTASNKTTAECYESQNYIPLCGERARNTNNHPRKTSSTVSESNLANSVSVATSAVTSTVTTSRTDSCTVSRITDSTGTLLENYGTLSSAIPDTLNNSISNLLCRASRRPPGPLSMNFEECLPNSAGEVTANINSMAHNLTNYFRGMIVEFLMDMSRTDSYEGKVTAFRTLLEDLMYKHSEELRDLKRNIDCILRDVDKHIEEVRTRAIEETQKACESETLRRVEEAKSKQWCSNCSKEAQFYCCWNTSYCDFPCQEMHWPKHMSKCTQNIQNSQPSQSTNVATVTVTKPPQSLLLRQTPSAKSLTPKPLIAKPTKVIVNRANAVNSISYVRTSSGNHLTLVESTPGNYELVGNSGPISVGGKVISGKIRGNVIPTPCAHTVPSIATGVKGTPQKSVLLCQTNSLQPTTSVISDDEEE